MPTVQRAESRKENKNGCAQYREQKREQKWVPTVQREQSQLEDNCTNFSAVVAAAVTYSRIQAIPLLLFANPRLFWSMPLVSFPAQASVSGNLVSDCRCLCICICLCLCLCLLCSVFVYFSSATYSNDCPQFHIPLF